MEQFKEELIDILEVDELNNSDILRDFEEWDSLTVLSIISAIADRYDITISANDLSTMITIKDLFKFIEANK